MVPVQILLPVFDKEGRSILSNSHGEVRLELVERFGGVTADGRAPADGDWRDEGETKRDLIVVVEVMASDRMRRGGRPTERGWRPASGRRASSCARTRSRCSDAEHGLPCAVEGGSLDNRRAGHGRRRL